jgi:hypothetical protein
VKKALSILAVTAVAMVLTASPARPAGVLDPWPDASTTGPRVAITTNLGDTRYTSYTVVNSTHFAGGVVVDGATVVFIDSIFEGDGSDNIGIETVNGGIAIVQHSRITGNYPVAGAYGRNLTIQYTDITGLPLDGVLPGMASIIEHNYFHDFRTRPGVFADAIQTWDTYPGYGASWIGLSINHNFVWMSNAQSTALSAQPVFGGNPYSQLSVTGNLFIGGAGFTVYIADAGTDRYGEVVFQNNHIFALSAVYIAVTNLNPSRDCGNVTDTLFAIIPLPLAPFGDPC